MEGANSIFRLRWDHQQSTLIEVFNALLESSTLVDCTLAAEGQYLKAHKVVLSACSPYLQLLLSQNYEKHPILILKDVKFQDLKSMIAYMYKGEISMTQTQLSSFLKAAESLQIKGLTDSGESEYTCDTPSTTPVMAPIPAPVRKSVEQFATRGPSAVAQASGRRSASPYVRSNDNGALSTPRKRSRNQRIPFTSDDPDSHIDSSNSCDDPSLQSAVLSEPKFKISNTLTKRASLDGNNKTDNSHINNHNASASLVRPKIEPPCELIDPKIEHMGELKTEAIIEDLTLDDDDMENSMDTPRAGPSHDNSNQSFGQWPMSGSQITDEEFISQEEGGAHGDTTGKTRF